VRSSPRCVLDTNVMVSAPLFNQSTPAQAFFTALHDGEILVSADAIAELNEVLGREMFARYVSEDVSCKICSTKPDWSRSGRKFRRAATRKTTSSPAPCQQTDQRKNDTLRLE
jgi:PIN domain